jgi:hypothetical protein
MIPAALLTYLKLFLSRCLKLIARLTLLWAQVQTCRQQLLALVAKVAQLRSQIGSVDASENLEAMPNQSLVVLSVSRSPLGFDCCWWSLDCICARCDKFAVHLIRAWRRRRLVIPFLCWHQKSKELLRLTRRSLDLQFDSRLLNGPDANLNCDLVFLAHQHELFHPLAQRSFKSPRFFNLREGKRAQLSFDPAAIIRHQRI